MSARSNLSKMLNWFSPFDSCLVAFSGGVDSSVVAYSAREVLGERAIAATSLSPAFASSEIVEARRMAQEIGIRFVSVAQDDLGTKEYVENQISRCYYCRRNLATALLPILNSEEIEVWTDGTQADDLLVPRPGIKALREAGFRAPLAELGFGKAEVREMARAAGLSNSERPSEACLSSRIAFGEQIDEVKLRRVELSESYVRTVTQAKIVRVRTIGNSAHVEVDRDSIRKALEQRTSIELKLRSLGFRSVTIDEQGYTPGRMLSLFIKEKEMGSLAIGD